MRVIFGRKFAEHVPNFPKADKEKIVAFANHIENFGFDGLQGRNKSSDDVPVTHPDWSDALSMPKRIIYGIITLVFLIMKVLKKAI